MSLTDHLRSAGINLPPVSGPFGAYVPAKRVGNLIYVAGQLPMKDGKLMAVSVTPGEALEVSRPTALFQSPIPLSPEMNTRRNHYVASSDGQRFLINAAADSQESMTVLVNWSRLLPE